VAVLINGLLLGLFAVQHAVMARPGFKAWWTRIVPAAAERSTFVLSTCVVLALLVWQWRPIEGIVWRVDWPMAAGFLYAVSFLGWGIVLYSSFLIDHFDLFGLRQVWFYFRGKQYTSHPFVERSLYRLVRHPLMLGFLIAFWATPNMTAGHLVFALLTTGYILIGTRIEERDLVQFLGDAYLSYRARTPGLIPFLRPRAKAVDTTGMFR
jgi:protein-S-isoprenylcysteine O-methyltransferase Ste14